MNYKVTWLDDKSCMFNTLSFGNDKNAAINEAAFLKEAGSKVVKMCWYDHKGTLRVDTYFRLGGC